MKRPFRSSIEPLESRIAPAILVNGPNLLGTGNPATGEMSLGDNNLTLVKVTAGQIIVWYQDGDISSVSFGQGANFQITGDVLGDIVGNLGANGRLSDSDGDPVNGEDGNILLPNDLVGLKTTQFSTQKGGFRYLITGGSAANLNINGQIEGIYTGDGAFDAESDAQDAGDVVSSVGFDVNPLTAGIQNEFTFTKATAQMKAGAGLKNAVIGIGKELEIFTGGGNPSGAAPDPLKAGAPGGDIANITIKSAFLDAQSNGSTPSYQLKTGGGGDGKTGGKGGDIATVVEESSVGSVFFNAGNGGAGSGGKGGNGGSLRLLEMRSDSTRYEFHAGNGGSGAPAGAGGSIITSNFTNLTSTGGIIRAADFTGDGADDLLIVDTATGKMVIMENDGTGTNFTPVVQHVVDDVNEIFIPPSGSTPSDVAIADMDHDGDLDIYVCYKNDNTVGIFSNQGGGSFWNEFEGVYSIQEFHYLFTPSFIIPAEFGGSRGLDYVLVEVRTGKTIVHQVVSVLSNDLSKEIWEVGADLGVYSSEATAVAYGSDPENLNIFIGFKNGHVGSVRGGALLLYDAGLAIPGGVGQLALDSSEQVLAAVGSSGRDLRVFNVAGADLVALPSPALPVTGKATIAHFTHDADANTPDKLAVLFSSGGSSRIDQFSVTSGSDPIDPALTWSAPLSLESLNPLKNFVAVNATGAFQGYAALGAALNQVSFSLNGAGFTDFSLPFTGKRVFLFGGDGGTGIDVGTLAGKGGAGGGIIGLNVIATDVTVTAGQGGDANNGGGGAGGGISNGATLVTPSGQTVVPKIEAETTLAVIAGDGGSPLGTGGKTASGGAGGGISGITGTLKTGELIVTAGNGGSGKGAAGGAGGGVGGATLINKGGNLVLTAGNGGDATVGKFAGGAGGGISGLKYTLLSGEEAEQIEANYSATLTTGNGGDSAQGTGGAGGFAQNTTILVDPPDRSYNNATAAPPKTDAHVDSTFRFSLTTGDGGNGIAGGKGGSSSNFKMTVVYDQSHENGGILPAYAVADIFLGDGGDGSAGNGGDGGTFTGGRFTGLSKFDPDAPAPVGNPSYTPLRITGGNGGNGSLKGGAGGGVAVVSAHNSQFGEPGSSEEGVVTFIGTTLLEGAEFYSGAGGAGGTGDGGKGGDISGLNLGVQFGLLYAIAGDGGAGGAKGGGGGAVKSSTMATVSTIFDNAIVVDAGDGGDGVTAGGVGGALMGLNFNAPPGKLDISGVQTTLGEPIVLFAGHGGAASGAGGKGGAGGDVNGITHTKDIFSSISAIIAGNGGDSTGGGFGGKGGNVLNVRTVGFIGKPTDGVTKLGAFNELDHEQGLFVGRGGAGATAGVNGSVTGVVARQISAIGAAANVAGIFGAAEKVSNVKADLIGYDVDSDGLFDGATASPGSGKPVDGFLLAKVLSGVSGNRAAFTFTA